MNSQMLEDSLITELEQQTAKYSEALALLRQSASGPAVDVPVWDRLHPLHSLMADVSARGERIREMQTDWLVSQLSVGPRLQAALSSAQATLTELIRQIDSAMAATESARQQLLPKLDVEVRRRRMRIAYANMNGQRFDRGRE